MHDSLTFFKNVSLAVFFFHLISLSWWYWLYHWLFFWHSFSFTYPHLQYVQVVPSFQLLLNFILPWNKNSAEKSIPCLKYNLLCHCFFFLFSSQALHFLLLSWFAYLKNVHGLLIALKVWIRISTFGLCTDYWYVKCIKTLKFPFWGLWWR